MCRDTIWLQILLLCWDTSLWQMVLLWGILTCISTCILCRGYITAVLHLLAYQITLRVVPDSLDNWYHNVERRWFPSGNRLELCFFFSATRLLSPPGCSSLSRYINVNFHFEWIFNRSILISLIAIHEQLWLLAHWFHEYFQLYGFMIKKSLFLLVCVCVLCQSS